MSTTVRQPRLLDISLHEIGRLSPSKGSYKLSTNSLSTASLTLFPYDDRVSAGQFVEMYDVYGSIGVFRVSSVKHSLSSKGEQISLSLEHGVTSLSDYMIVGEVAYAENEKTVSQISSEILSGQELWALGECDFTELPIWHFLVPSIAYCRKKVQRKRKSTNLL